MSKQRQTDLEVPALAEYTPLAADEKWRVEKFRELAAEFALTPDQMPMFHETASSQPRTWEFIRRLFGINPLLLADDAAPEDFVTLTRAQLCAQHGLKGEHLQAELDAVRGLWGRMAQPEENVPRRGEGGEVRSAGGDLLGAEDREGDVLREFGFDANMFENVMMYDPAADAKSNPEQMVRRSRAKNLEERAWFVMRCEDSRKMYKEPHARTRVRDLLFNELHIGRLQDQLLLVATGSRDFERFDKKKGELQERFDKQLDRLQEMFPDLNVANRISFRQVISTLNQSERDFYGDGNNVRRTALFTAAEIEVLSRQSVQNPQAQYRFSLELLVLEAVHGLYDRNFRSQLAKKPRTLKLLDLMSKAAINKARELHNSPLVDLEEGVTPDEGSQHEELIELEMKKEE